MGDVDEGMRAVILGDHDLPVLPHAEHQCQQEDQSGRQQGDPDVDAQRVTAGLDKLDYRRVYAIRVQNLTPKHHLGTDARRLAGRRRHRRLRVRVDL